MIESFAMFCASCGGEAARFELLRQAPGQQAELRRRGFLAETTYLGTDEEIVPTYQALRAGGATLQLLRHDAASLVCPVCSKAYCESCWTIEPPDSDEGFYDCTYGICPHGHRSMVDD